MSTTQDMRQAWGIWQKGRAPDRQHPYLIQHRIDPLQLRQTRQGALILPLCVRERFQGVRLIHWDLSRPITTIGGMRGGCYVPTGRRTAGQPLVVVEDWASAVVLHKRGLNAWASLSLDNLSMVAFQARRIIGADGQLVVAGDNSEDGARRADMIAASRGAELILPGRPIGAPQWVNTFADLARWNAGSRRASA